MRSPLAVLADAQVPLLLIGGTAVQAYGYSRFTKDFDCVIAHESAAALGELLRNEGFAEFYRSDVVLRYRNPETGWVIDALPVDGATFSKLWNKRREVKLGDRLLPIAGPLHLIAMKLHAVKNSPARKLPDLVDMLELVCREHRSFTREEIELVCDRYGTAELKSILLDAYDENRRVGS
jgi:hypothetical protein